MTKFHLPQVIASSMFFAMFHFLKFKCIYTKNSEDFLGLKFHLFEYFRPRGIKKCNFACLKQKVTYYDYLRPVRFL